MKITLNDSDRQIKSQRVDLLSCHDGHFVSHDDDTNFLLYS